jgi:glycosyltransferase involved in cell wall biosynthesis
MFISTCSFHELLRLRGTNTSISVILPVYNEQKRIKQSLERLISYFKGAGWDYQLIFVDDRSTDNTSLILDEYRQKEENIEILIPPIHLGKGGSIVYAALTLASTTKKYLAYMDSDLAADPSELERLLEYIDDYDMVIGSRILRGKLGPIRRPMHRSFFSRFYSKLFRTLFRIPIRDPQCGLKLFKREVISSLFGDITTMGFAFDTDMIVTAFSQRLRIKEVPINWVHGKSSKLHLLTEIQKMGIDLFSIWYHSHLSWKERKMCYPQKKGSIYGRVLFDLLSLSNNVKTRPLSPKFNTLLNTNLIKTKLP